LAERFVPQVEGKRTTPRIEASERLKRRGLRAAVRRSLRKSAIDNLADGVNGFPLAGTAAKNKNAGDQLESGVVGLGIAMSFLVFTQDDTWNTHRLIAMAAKNTAERLRGRIY